MTANWARSRDTCAACGTKLSPFSATTFTAHEFDCYKKYPYRIPDGDRRVFEEMLKWERRSEAGRRGAATRRQRKHTQRSTP